MMPGSQAHSLALSPKGLRDPFFYLVSDLPEDLKLLLLRTLGQSRVLETSVNDLSCFGRFGRKLQLRAADGAGLFGPVADCYRQVKYCILKFLG